MFGWLSAQQEEGENTQSLNNGAAEPPETPAHTFIGRAFKQAIFGTPAAPATEKRRREMPRSNSTRERPGPARPTILPRRRSADYASRSSANASGSPAKGILLTPGTAAGKRKSVSFNANQDFEKRVLYDPIHGPEDDNDVDARPSTEDSPERTDFSRRLFEAAPRTELPIADTQEDGMPKSPAQWKAEMEAASQRNSAELRKLSKKEQIAKKFARERDEEASRLEKQLREARATARETDAGVASLKHRNESLQSQLDSLQKALEAQRRSYEDQLARLKRENTVLQGEIKGARREARSVSPAKRATPVREQNSDIWADAGGVEPSPAKAVSRRNVADRSPLKPRVANGAPSDESTTKEEDAKTVANALVESAALSRKPHLMPEERLAAARARLEARRKARTGT